MAADRFAGRFCAIPESIRAGFRLYVFLLADVYESSVTRTSNASSVVDCCENLEIFERIDVAGSVLLYALSS